MGEIRKTCKGVGITWFDNIRISSALTQQRRVPPSCRRSIENESAPFDVLHTVTLPKPAVAGLEDARRTCNIVSRGGKLGVLPCAA